MDTGVCVICGTEEIEVNDEGKCTGCEGTKSESGADAGEVGEDME